MVRNLARGVFQYPQPPRIISYASTVGQKEGDGPMGSCFDCVEPDAHFGQETWEQAESVMQRRTVQLALEKSGLRDSDLSCICAGDLMNQCIGSTYGMRPLEIPLLGIYGACSTMAEGLLTASFLAAGGVGEYTAAVTSSHFSTAERQFRFPLSYGGQRPPTAQWTCTGSGAVIFQQPDGVPDGVCVTGACIGIMVDLGVTDANHMGAAMAPAAADTIVRYLKATQTAPEQYDAIVTGDLFLYDPQKGVTLGEYISAPRLDDLQCAFSSLTAFLAAGESRSIPVCCIFDNEEVGSETKQGAASTFLYDTLTRLCAALGMDGSEYRRLVAGSFLVSCDNAHAVHPNHSEFADRNHTARMNGGVVIKYNANQRYTSDAVSAGIFRRICESAGVPVQYYANRADMPGGSTLGNISNTQVSLNAVDIGLAQLAMHSPFETAGAADTASLVKALTAFFEHSLVAERDGVYRFL